MLQDEELEEPDLLTHIKWVFGYARNERFHRCDSASTYNKIIQQVCTYISDCPQDQVDVYDFTLSKDDIIAHGKYNNGRHWLIFPIESYNGEYISDAVRRLMGYAPYYEH